MSQLSIQSQMNEMRLRDQRSSERIQLREGSASAQSTPWTISCPDPGAELGLTCWRMSGLLCSDCGLQNCGKLPVMLLQGLKQCAGCHRWRVVKLPQSRQIYDLITAL